MNMLHLETSVNNLFCFYPFASHACASRDLQSNYASGPTGLCLSSPPFLSSSVGNVVITGKRGENSVLELICRKFSIFKHRVLRLDFSKRYLIIKQGKLNHNSFPWKS